MSGWRRRREEKHVSVGEVEILRETERAFLCRWTDGSRERWVPKGQMNGSSTSCVGDIVDLEVTEWFHERLDEGEEERERKWVEVPGTVVMRETERAIQVRVDGRDQLLWIPKTQIKKGSEVQNDGDSGTLTISEYIAKEKGFGEGGSGGRSAGEDARQQHFGVDPDDDLKF